MTLGRFLRHQSELCWPRTLHASYGLSQPSNKQPSKSSVNEMPESGCSPGSLCQPSQCGPVTSALNNLTEDSVPLSEMNLAVRSEAVGAVDHQTQDPVIKRAPTEAHKPCPEPDEAGGPAISMPNPTLATFQRAPDVNSNVIPKERSWMIAPAFAPVPAPCDQNKPGVHGTRGAHMVGF